MIREIDGGAIALGREIGRGRSACVYRVGGDRVAKLFHGEGRGAALAEVRKTLAARAAGVAAPEIEGLVTIEGRSGFIAEFVPGEPLNRLLARRPDRALPAADMLADIHRRLGALPAPAQLPRAGDIIARHLDAAWLGAPARARFAEAAEALPHAEPRLCHGNLSTRNLILDGERVRVIDWGSAFAGPAMLDAALTLQFLHSFTPSRRATLPGRILGRVMAHRLRKRVAASDAALAEELRAFEPFGALIRASALRDRPGFERDLVGLLDRRQAASAGAKRV